MEATFTDEISAIQEHLAREIGVQQYQIWFRNATQLTLRKDCLEIAVANPFISQWIQSHFEKPLQKAMEAALHQRHPIHYRTDRSLSPAGSKTNPNPAERIPAGRS